MPTFAEKNDVMRELTVREPNSSTRAALVLSILTMTHPLSSSIGAYTPYNDTNSRDKAGTSEGDNYSSGGHNPRPSPASRPQQHNNATAIASSSTTSDDLRRSSSKKVSHQLPEEENGETYDETNILDRLFHETVDAPCRSVSLCEGMSIEHQLDLLTVRFAWGQLFSYSLFGLLLNLLSLFFSISLSI